LISEGDLIDLLSKVSVYIIFHFMRFLIRKRRSHPFLKGDVFSAKFNQKYTPRVNVVDLISIQRSLVTI
jgi:hypothetical protein